MLRNLIKYLLYCVFVEGVLQIRNLTSLNCVAELVASAGGRNIYIVKKKYVATFAEEMIQLIEGNLI